MSQEQLGEYLNVQKTAITHLESEVSRNENAKKEKTIPTAYLQLMNEKGISLNWLFDNNDLREDVVLNNAAIAMVAEERTPYINNCSNCKVKDAEIADLKQKLNTIESILHPKKQKAS